MSDEGWEQVREFLTRRVGDLRGRDPVDDYIQPFLVPTYLEIIQIDPIEDLQKRGSSWSILGRVRKNTHGGIRYARGCSGKVVPDGFVNGEMGW